MLCVPMGHGLYTMCGCVAACLQVGEVVVGLLEYQEAVSKTQAASKGLASKADYTAANTPATPSQHVKPPHIYEARG